MNTRPGCFVGIALCAASAVLVLMVIGFIVGLAK